MTPEQLVITVIAVWIVFPALFFTVIAAIIGTAYLYARIKGRKWMLVDLKPNGEIFIEGETLFERAWLGEHFSKFDSEKFWLETKHDSFSSELTIRPVNN